MDDLALRVIIALVVGVTAVAVGFALRGGKALRRKPFRARGLEPGLHFFSSSTCSSCERVRSLLVDSGFPFVEHGYEQAGATMQENQIDRVPSVAFVSDAGVDGWIAEGVPSAASLRRWLGP